MTSGRYLGETVGKILLDLPTQGLLFRGRVSSSCLRLRGTAGPCPRPEPSCPTWGSGAPGTTASLSRRCALSRIVLWASQLGGAGLASGVDKIGETVGWTL